MTAAVSLSGAVKRYGTNEVVHGVSLALAPGERLALLGHNGAGKTTLMKLVLGLTRATAGRIRTLGADPVGAANSLRGRIGFLPENVAFHDGLTGWETLRYYARLKRRPASECAELLEQVGLAEAAKRRVGTYSKGMRQRLGLAQALLGRPELLLLDEPTVGLDPELRLAVFAIISALAAAGTAVLLSSHLLTELEERTDRIAIMDRGRLLADGTLDELRAAAALPVRFRVKPAADAAGAVAARLAGFGRLQRDETSLSLEAPPATKLAVIAVLGELAARLRDVEIQPPSLDDIYAHFTGAKAGVEPTP